jgi:hypothetical protein
MLSSLYAKLAGLAIILALITGAYAYVGHLKHEVTELTAQNTILTSKLQDQNAAITQLKIDSDAREVAGKAAIAAAAASVAAGKAQAKIIYQTKPSKPNDLCRSTIDLINGAKK